MKKQKHPIKGACSICGSMNVEYGSTELEGESIGYKIHCNDCGANGLEWYNLVYDTTTMK